MKVALEIPDKTLCVFFNYITDDPDGLTMRCYSIQTRELQECAVLEKPIVIEGGEK